MNSRVLNKHQDSLIATLFGDYNAISLCSMILGSLEELILATVPKTSETSPNVTYRQINTC